MPEVVGSGKRRGSSHAAESAFGRPQPGARRATVHTRHSLAAWTLEGDARRRILSSIVTLQRLVGGDGRRLKFDPHSLAFGACG